MQVLEKGTYLANATLTEFPSMRAQDMGFTSKDNSFVAIVPIWNNISLQTGAVYLTYSNSYDAVNDVYAVTLVYTYSTGTWNDEAYRTIVISEEMEVQESVKLWFDQNFTFYPETGTEPEPFDDLKPVYLRQNGVWSKKEAYEHQSGQWVKISSSET